MNPTTRAAIENISDTLLTKTRATVIPVDLNKIAKHLGLTIQEENFEDNLSGVLLRNEKVIAINKSHSDRRKKFTIAHEIGHFIIHTKLDKFFDGVYKREKINTTANNVHETQANEFAASLLMPKKELLKSIEEVNMGKIQSLSQLAEVYRVSEQAMSFRLLNLGFLINH